MSKSDGADDKRELKKLIEVCSAVSQSNSIPAEDEEFGPSIQELNANDEDDSLAQTCLPLSSHMNIRHGTRGSVSAIALDRSGDRLLTGGTDCHVKFWDFNSISDENSAIRSLQPCGSHVIRDLSIAGDLVLVISASAQARLVNRDGRAICECIKGDQYLVDMSKTKGHVSSLNSGMFDPLDQTEFLTCSDDGTARIWDVNRARFEHKSLIKARGFRNGSKCGMSGCCYSKNAIIVGTDDGSVYLWDKRRQFVTPTHRLQAAHNEPVFGISVSYDDFLIVTRSLDDVVIWDKRKSLKEPLKQLSVPVRRRSDVCFSPDDSLAIIAASKGQLIVVNRSTLEVETLKVYDDYFDEINRLIFHPRLHQIFCARSDGIVCVHYDPAKSTKGATNGYRISKKPKSEKGFFANDPIINPLALPMFRQEKIRNLNAYRARERNSESVKRRPEMPISGAGEGGRIGHHGGTLSSYIVKNIALQQVNDSKEDPREALLKYAEKAAKEPFWITPAYKRTQPIPLFEEVDNKEDDEKKKKRRKSE